MAMQSLLDDEVYHYHHKNDVEGTINWRCVGMASGLWVIGTTMAAFILIWRVV